MARLNIEDCWWTDPRRSALIRLIGDESLADGVAIRAWRLAQDFWKHGRALVPKVLFETLQEASKLIQVGLAEVRGEQVYVRGSSTYLDWINDQKEKARAGGKKSAQRSRDAKGRLKKTSKQTPSEVQPESKSIQASSSLSSSSSPSDSSFRFMYSKGEENETESGEASEGVKSPIGFFIANYVNAYQQRYGDKARPSLSGKVQGQVRTLLKDVPLDRACELIQTYLGMSDAWFLTKAHDFGTFVQNLDKIGLALDTGHKMTQARARNSESADYAHDQLRRIAEGKL